ncbi:hypothetical protein I203_103180 [Kwoniella mangroviensis CBS 8507]|uniref:uncharacterized protein n=1 Tax=Kwoniella mangroviensis CBS 8507 TaxID=1296122 RepID=UPI00080D611A|nr:uncharacterized protein I203_07446 [Kwoniella mangroviensis CBS 8507]OCF63380.1 hypothetical protein I203_07446 [Kwoniella mangroviensis CBS 8507]
MIAEKLAAYSSSPNDDSDEAEESTKRTRERQKVIKGLMSEVGSKGLGATVPFVEGRDSGLSYAQLWKLLLVKNDPHVVAAYYMVSRLIIYQKHNSESFESKDNVSVPPIIIDLTVSLVKEIADFKAKDLTDFTNLPHPIQSSLWKVKRTEELPSDYQDYDFFRACGISKRSKLSLKLFETFHRNEGRSIAHAQQQMRRYWNFEEEDNEEQILIDHLIEDVVEQMEIEESRKEGRRSKIVKDNGRKIRLFDDDDSDGDYRPRKKPFEDKHLYENRQSTKKPQGNHTTRPLTAAKNDLRRQFEILEESKKTSTK